MASGIAQVILAGLVLWRRPDWALRLVIAINVALIVIYSYAVLVGLPSGSGPEHVHTDTAGLVVGAGEPIDAYGAISKIAEVVSGAIAFALLAATRLQNPLGSTN